MTKKKVLLCSGDKVNRFVATATKYRFPIHLTTGRYRIDGKSLIGIFSLNLSKPVTVEVPEDGENLEEFLEEIQEFEYVKTE